MFDQSKGFFEAVPILFYLVLRRDILQVKLFTFTAHLLSIKITEYFWVDKKCHLWIARNKPSHVTSSMHVWISPQMSLPSLMEVYQKHVFQCDTAAP